MPSVLAIKWQGELPKKRNSLQPPLRPYAVLIGLCPEKPTRTQGILFIFYALARRPATGRKPPWHTPCKTRRRALQLCLSARSGARGSHSTNEVTEFVQEEDSDSLRDSPRSHQTGSRHPTA